MDNEQDNQNNQSRYSLSRLFILILVYLFLTMSTRYSERQSHHGLVISQKIGQPLEEIKLQDLGTLYQYDQLYSGVWKKTGKGEEIGIAKNQGQLQMVLSRVMGTKNQRFLLKLTLSNGQYIDQGVVELDMILQASKLKSTRPQNNSIQLQWKDEEKKIDSSYSLTKILITQEEGPLLINHFSFKFTKDNDNNLLKAVMKIEVGLEQVNQKLSTSVLEIQIHGHSNKILKLLLFAGILFAISYLPFIAALELLKKFYEDSQNPLHYSLFTVTIATMWDTVLCMVAFKMAFNDQESLVLFILPAFMLCILFTNIEPRMMSVIFERNQMGNERNCFSLYSLISYGSTILIYPIMVITNLNSYLFLALSCMLFPQIYLNAVRGHRPDYSSEYYTKFIFSRFIFVAYLRCFPYNVFNLRPDYGLTLACLFLLCVQIGLLNMQRKYGPKVVVPKWMLEPVYDYNYEEMLNLEQGADDKQCSICLALLKSDPPMSEEDVDLPFRVMKTPCKHSYHSSCLISWMKIKMQCPQCRAALPPYE